jgi:hypothetical protein
MKTTRLVWSGVLAVGVFAAMPASVKAEPRVGIAIVVNGGHGYDSRGAFRYGFERGRSEGAARGYRDGRRGRGGDFRRDSWYRGGDRGYHGWMGARWDYAAGYRQGYETAYRRACDSARSGGRDRGYGDGYGYGYDGRDRDSGYGRGDDQYRGDGRYNGEDWRR